MSIHDVARSAADRLEAMFESLVLSRDPELHASLRESETRLRAGETGSVEDLRAALEAGEDRPVAH